MAGRIVKVSLATAATLVASAFGSTIYLESAKTNECFTLSKPQGITLNEAVEVADKLCEQVKNESGIPGLVVSVSIDGIPAYQRGWMKIYNSVYVIINLLSSFFYNRIWLC